MPDWLLFSVVASVVLTVVLNIALRVFPGARRGLEELFGRMANPVDTADRTNAADRSANEPGVRVIVPWKFMLVASLILTVAINVLLRLI